MSSTCLFGTTDYENGSRLTEPRTFVIKGVGTLIALTFLLTLEDPHRFGKSRDVGGYLGLQPGRRKSGESEPQLHISKEGDPYLRTLLVQGAQHILGPFGIDCDLRRWGLKLAERGGRNGKKRAIVATARKLAGWYCCTIVDANPANVIPATVTMSVNGGTPQTFTQPRPWTRVIPIRTN